MNDFVFNAIGIGLTIVMLCITIVTVILTYKFVIDFII